MTKDKVQGLMNEYAVAVEKRAGVQAQCADASKKLRAERTALTSRIKGVEGAFDEKLTYAMDEEAAILLCLKEEAEIVYRDGGFPEGKKRLSLEGKAWVQVSERSGFKVVDPSQVVRFVLEKGIEDTTIESVKLNRDAVNGVFATFKKFPGVKQTTTGSVSVSLPKENK